jgi:hypothetical protein
MISPRIRWLPVPVAIICVTTVICGQEPVEVPAPESLDLNFYEPPAGAPGEVRHVASDRPAVSIGGPFGVIIGNGRGMRIGGPNGVQFGGGAGARFGGRNGVQFGGGAGARFGGHNGVQFGGGEGVRIGPSTYGPDPEYRPNRPPSVLDQSQENNEPQTTIHHPRTASQAVRLRINGQDTQISPGETIYLTDEEQPATLQFVRPNGRYGFRRSLSPGNYVFRETGRGWSLAAVETPPEASSTEPMPAAAGEAGLRPPVVELPPESDFPTGTGEAPLFQAP